MIVLKISWIIQIVSALLLILLILLHSPKGDGILGIGGASHLFASQRNAESGLTKLTTIIAVIFFVTTFITGFKIFAP